MTIMLKVCFAYLFIFGRTSIGVDQTFNIRCGSRDQDDEDVRPAFHASMIKHPYKFSDPNEILRFEHVWTNTGDGYKPETGIFTTPRAGLYQIMGTLWSTSGKRCAASLYRNEVILNYGYTSTEHADSNTVHALVVLQKGDRIYFKNRGSINHLCHGNYHSEFSAFYVQK